MLLGLVLTILGLIFFSSFYTFLGLILTIFGLVFVFVVFNVARLAFGYTRLDLTTFGLLLKGLGCRLTIHVLLLTIIGLLLTILSF